MPKLNIFSILLCLLLVTNCASNSQNVQTQKIDRISEEELMRIIPKPFARLSLDDLAKLTQKGFSADQIIEKIKLSHSTYDLTPSQSVALNKQGVDIKVLDYIHTSRESALQNSVADEINQREKIMQIEIKKLKHQQWLERHRFIYDPHCDYGSYGLYPYGYGAFDSGFGLHSHLGIGLGMPLGCW
jgi:hypothetical protein